jgi:hypothetical protein
MEEARSVLARLGRIETMRRANAGPAELLGELRCLLQEAEAWVVQEQGGAAAEQAIAKLRTSLERGSGEVQPRDGMRAA